MVSGKPPTPDACIAHARMHVYSATAMLVPVRVLLLSCRNYQVAGSFDAKREQVPGVSECECV